MTLQKAAGLAAYLDEFAARLERAERDGWLDDPLVRDRIRQIPQAALRLAKVARRAARKPKPAPSPVTRPEAAEVD